MSVVRSHFNCLNYGEGPNCFVLTSGQMFARLAQVRLTLWGEREIVKPAVNHPWGHGCSRLWNLGANSNHWHCGHLHSVALLKIPPIMASR